MMNPGKAPGFLDFSGEWNPRRPFVLVGAVGISALGFGLKVPMAHPLLAPRFEVPTNPKPILVSSAVQRCTASAGSPRASAPAGLGGLFLGLPQGILFPAAMLAGCCSTVSRSVAGQRCAAPDHRSGDDTGAARPQTTHRDHGPTRRIGLCRCVDYDAPTANAERKPKLQSSRSIELVGIRGTVTSNVVPSHHGG
ncbi:DUF6691 family protein [Methylobacterium sp. AMS5]|uniref:DUF6691 family protein n=1 Tax=Methylobacteriaceae TaxID=119045 RepID=UPI00336A5EDC